MAWTQVRSNAKVFEDAAAQSVLRDAVARHDHVPSNRDTDRPLKEMRKLMKFLEAKLAGTLRRQIVERYANICATGATRDVFAVDHKIVSAAALLEHIKHVDGAVRDELLQDEGFWILVDKRRSQDVDASEHVHLREVLEHGEDCPVHFDQHAFGSRPNPLYYAFDSKRPCTTSLSKFMAYGARLEATIRQAMADVVGADAVYDAFAEALFYCIPSEFSICYGRDLDIDRDVHLKRVLARVQHSLVDAPMEPFVRSTGEKNEGRNQVLIDCYEFPNVGLRGIRASDSRVASSFPLVDDAFGRCVEGWCTGDKRAILRIIDGVNRGAIITSMFGARTSVHVEDAFLCTFNLLVAGAPKIWYVVPRRHALGFRQFLVDRGLFQNTLEKRCFVEAFATGCRGMEEHDMRRFEICRIVQYPGMGIMSAPGEIYHWTISTGFSLAESANWFTTAAGHSLGELKVAWTEFLGRLMTDSSGTSVQFFDICEAYGIMD